jgi:hypothetical protein
MSIHLFTALALILATRAFAQTPPSNDDFANRTVLVGSSITFTGTLAGASLENAETNNSFAFSFRTGRSVWWTWTATESSRLVIAIQPDSLVNLSNADLSVYTGSDLNGLTMMDDNAFMKPSGRYVCCPPSLEPLIRFASPRAKATTARDSTAVRAAPSPCN